MNIKGQKDEVQAGTRIIESHLGNLPDDETQDGFRQPGTIKFRKNAEGLSQPIIANPVDGTTIAPDNKKAKAYVIKKGIKYAQMCAGISYPVELKVGTVITEQYFPIAKLKSLGCELEEISLTEADAFNTIGPV